MNRTRLGEWGVLVLVWLGLVALFGTLADHFLSATTLTTVASRLPALAVIAAGMTLVIIAGGIDLSVGSVMALAGAVLGVAIVQWGWPLAAAIPVAILTGALAGLGTGLLTVGLRIPSFLVTLGSLEVCRGLTYAVCDSRTLFIGAAIRPLAQRWRRSPTWVPHTQNRRLRLPTPPGPPGAPKPARSAPSLCANGST
jgi:ribose transport system permease protein